MHTFPVCDFASLLTWTRTPESVLVAFRRHAQGSEAFELPDGHFAAKVEEAFGLCLVSAPSPWSTSAWFSYSYAVSAGPRLRCALQRTHVGSIGFIQA